MTLRNQPNKQNKLRIKRPATSQFGFLLYLGTCHSACKSDTWLCWLKYVLKYKMLCLKIYSEFRGPFHRMKYFFIRIIMTSITQLFLKSFIYYFLCIYVFIIYSFVYLLSLFFFFFFFFLGGGGGLRCVCVCVCVWGGVAHLPTMSDKRRDYHRLRVVLNCIS